MKSLLSIFHVRPLETENDQETILLLCSKKGISRQRRIYVSQQIRVGCRSTDRRSCHAAAQPHAEMFDSLSRAAASRNVVGRAR